MRRIGVIAACLALWPGIVGAATYIVNDTDDVDDGSCNAAHCSLREAVGAANASSGVPDVIEFESPVNGESMVIRLTSNLPAISDTLTIDGLSCANCSATAANTALPQDGFNSQLAVAIDGSGVWQFWSLGQGLLKVVNSTLHVSGLNLRNSPGSGIVFNGSGGSLSDCYLGTDLDGMTAEPNFGHGLNCLECSVDLDGTSLVVSGNDYQGLQINTSQLDGARIAGHLLGVAADGVTPLGNGLSGIHVVNARTDPLVGLQLGGDDPASQLVAGDNDLDGIHANGHLLDLEIRGTWLGVTPAGDDVGNGGEGLHMTSVAGVGAWDLTGTVLHGNVAGFNGDHGLRLSELTQAEVTNNYLGTDPSGVLQAGNQNGLYVRAQTLPAQNITVGLLGDTSAANVLAFNRENGARFHEASNSGGQVTDVVWYPNVSYANVEEALNLSGQA